MDKGDIVIRDLRQEESHQVREMLLSGLFTEVLTFRNAFKLTVNSENCVWVAILSVFFYILTKSVALAALVPVILTVLTSFVCLWRDIQQHMSHTQVELQDLHAWYNNIEPDSKFWVAVYRQNIIGSAALHRASETVAELKRMSVLPMYRRQGVGTRLLKHFEEHCRSAGIRKALITASEFGPGVHLYQKCGYVINSTFHRRMLPLPGALKTEWTLSKKLN